MSRKKIYTNDKLSGDSKKVFDTLNEGTDLACVLIGTSFLDEAVRSLLQKYFVKCNTAKTLLNPNRALGTFGSRCDLAYCLALIDKKIYKDLRVIEDIRNLFSHSHLEKTFNEDEIVSLTNNLKYCDFLKVTGMFYEVQNPTPEQIYISSRSRYNITVALLSSRLLLTALSIEHKERKK